MTTNRTSSIMEGNYNETIQGNYIQGNCYCITIVGQASNEEQQAGVESLPVVRSTSSSEYNCSNLVNFGIDFRNSYPTTQRQRQINIILNISFGEIEENYIYRYLGIIRNEGYIRFGIKFGTLNFKFPYQCMPSQQRRLPNTEGITGKVSFVGSDDNPELQFKAIGTSEAQDQEAVLFGSLEQQDLGFFNLLHSPCQVKATFQVNLNRNGLGITAQDGVWDDQTSKTKKVCKSRAFFKYVVEPKFQNNLAIVEIAI